MKKILIILTAVILLSCKTQTLYVENQRNLKDSTENVQLRKELNVKENLLSETQSQLELTKKEIQKLSEQFNLSESEKELLNERLTTIVEEYDQQGNLIKRTFSEKVSELAKDLTKSEQKNKLLEKELSENAILIETLKNNYNAELTEKFELLKKVEFLEQVNKELKSEKEVKSKTPWWLLIIGFAGGLVFYYYIPLIFKKVFS